MGAEEIEDPAVGALVEQVQVELAGGPETALTSGSGR